MSYHAISSATDSLKEALRVMLPPMHEPDVHEARLDFLVECFKGLAEAMADDAVDRFDGRGDYRDY